MDHSDQPELLDEPLYKELAAFFKPALLARMEVIPYFPLGRETLERVVRGKLARLEGLFKQRYGAEAIIEDRLISEILNRSKHSENGARMLEAIIDGQLLPTVSLALLNKLAAQEPVKRVYLDAQNGEFVGEVS